MDIFYKRFAGYHLYLSQVGGYDWKVESAIPTELQDSGPAVLKFNTEDPDIPTLQPLDLPVQVRFNNTSGQFHYYKDGQYVGFSHPGIDPFNKEHIAIACGAYIKAKLTAALSKVDGYLTNECYVDELTLAVFNPVNGETLPIRLPRNLLLLIAGKSL